MSRGYIGQGFIKVAHIRMTPREVIINSNFSLAVHLFGVNQKKEPSIQPHARNPLGFNRSSGTCHRTIMTDKVFRNPIEKTELKSSQIIKRGRTK